MLGKTLKARIAEDNLWADVSSGNNGEHPSSPYPMNPWTVVLTLEQRQMAIFWWTGRALAGDPTAQDVLEHLLLDASSVERSPDFKAWCADHGFTEGSRQEERLYQAHVRQTGKLREFLGEKYDTYLQTWAATEEVSMRDMAVRYGRQHDAPLLPEQLLGPRRPQKRSFWASLRRALR